MCSKETQQEQNTVYYIFEGGETEIEIGYNSQSQQTTPTPQSSSDLENSV